MGGLLPARLAAADRLQERCNIMKEQLFVVRDNIKSNVSEIVIKVKKSGKAVLYKISELFGMKEKHLSIRENFEDRLTQHP